ncbi:MAG TPA: TolC family protein [Phycisphaerales bacterium]|nr:TolC family protein [Phycisphaerales bacterium]
MAKYRVSSAAALLVLAGCTGPLDRQLSNTSFRDRIMPVGAEQPKSVLRDDDPADAPDRPILTDSSEPAEYIRYAMLSSPEVEAAYQRWRAAAERISQVGALPDPRLKVGFFLDEVETRTGPQNAKLGVSQSFPWPGTLSDREDAAARGAIARWYALEAVQLETAERVTNALYDLAYLDAATAITKENLDLLASFERVVRAQYRVGTGSHPELIRVQVELGQLEDRVVQLLSMRPAYEATLNAALNRPASSPVPTITRLPDRVASVDVEALVALASHNNPKLLAIDERVEQQRHLTDVARDAGMPDLTIGLDTIFTGQAGTSSIAESGDDPILLSFGITLPIWRDKYSAGVRESIANRLALANDRSALTNRIAAQIHRAWFEHTDADRRVRLYEQTLIPKARESLEASLAGFRSGNSRFLDLLDTERTLLEFSIAAERAHADRGKALARLNTLAGRIIQTKSAQPTSTNEVQP